MNIKVEQTLRLSGSSALPAYPGFIVMNIVQEGSREISVPSNINVFSCSATALWIVCTCWAITDNTYEAQIIYTWYYSSTDTKGWNTKSFTTPYIAHLQFNSIELIKTCPSPCLCQAFEELAHGFIIQTIRTVEYHTLFGHSLSQIFTCLCFACTSRPFRCSSQVQL